MNCTQCGTAAHPSTPYCIQCGTPIPTMAPAVVPPVGGPPQYQAAAAGAYAQPGYAAQGYPPPQQQYAPPQAPYAPSAQGQQVWNAEVGLLAGLQSQPPPPQYGYPQAPAIPYANFGLRLIALIIDEFLAFSAAGMAGGLVVVVGMLLALVGISTKSEGAAGGGIVAGIASYFIAFPVMFFAYLFYFVKLETSARQATLGKMMLGMKIVDASTGGKISVGQSLGRFFVKNLFSGWFFCIGFLMALFTEKKQALHDLAGGTLVVTK